MILYLSSYSGHKELVEEKDREVVVGNPLSGASNGSKLGPVM